jgi:hypothetical protein
MTKKEITTLADLIVEKIMLRLNEEQKKLEEDYVDMLIPDEEQLSDLRLLLIHYESNEKYTEAANVFKNIKTLENIIKISKQGED